MTPRLLQEQWIFSRFYYHWRTGLFIDLTLDIHEGHPEHRSRETSPRYPYYNGHITTECFWFEARAAGNAFRGSQDRLLKILMNSMFCCSIVESGIHGRPFAARLTLWLRYQQKLVKLPTCT